MVEANVADKTKLRGAIVEMSDRDVIAENVLRPSELQRRGSDLDFGFEYFPVAIVARTQHHPVLAESDWFVVVICRYVPDTENRHPSYIMATSATCIVAVTLRNMHFLGQILGMLFRNIVRR